MELCVQFFLTFLLLVCRAGSQNPPLQFGFELYKIVADESPTQNVVMSPLSVETALGLLFMGAGGRTGDQIVRALHYNTNDPFKIQSYFEKIHANYKSGNALILANKVYSKAAYKVKSAFNRIAQKAFNSEAESINFADSANAAYIINQWVYTKTGGKITNLFHPDQLDSSTRMVLVNALYFKGLWQHPFNRRGTQPRPFWIGENQPILTDMMFGPMRIKYGGISELDAQLAILPYQNSGLSMMILLPNKRTGLRELEAQIENYDLLSITSRLQPRMVDVTLPKFKIESTIELTHVLARLGVEDLFTEQANLTNLLNSPERLKVDTAVHKAFVEVDEEGTVAGAATGVGIIALSATPSFTVDHPFLFIIFGPDEVPLIGSIRRVDTFVN